MQFCHQRQTNSSTSYIVDLNLNLNIEMWLDFPGEFIVMKQLPVLAASMDPFTSSLTSLLTNSTAIQTSANMSSWAHEVIGKKAIGFCCRTGVSLGQTATEEERERRKGRGEKGGGDRARLTYLRNWLSPKSSSKTGATTRTPAIPAATNTPAWCLLAAVDLIQATNTTTTTTTTTPHTFFSEEAAAQFINYKRIKENRTERQQFLQAKNICTVLELGLYLELKESNR